MSYHAVQDVKVYLINQFTQYAHASLSTCELACLCTCICTGVRACMSEGVRAFVCVGRRACTRVCKCVCMRICRFACVYISRWLCVRACAYVWMLHVIHTYLFNTGCQHLTRLTASIDICQNIYISMVIPHFTLCQWCKMWNEHGNMYLRMMSVVCEGQAEGRTRHKHR